MTGTANRRESQTAVKLIRVFAGLGRPAVGGFGEVGRPAPNRVLTADR